MNIKTKFSLGDLVYTIYNHEIIDTKVSEINIHVDRFTVKTTYQLGAFGIFPERIIFETKEALLAALSK